MNNKILILIIGIVLLSSNVFAALNDYTATLYYPFDSDILNDGNMSNADLKGTYEGFVAGKVNYALNLELDNSQYVRNTTLTGAAVTKIRTVDVWIKPETIGGTDRWWYIIFQDGTDIFDLIQKDNNNILARLYTGGVSRFALTANTTTFEAGTWIHIVVVMGTGGAKLYVNGVVEASAVATNNMEADFLNIHIGRNVAANGYADGLIDNLFITSSRYTPADITESYNSGNGYDFSGVGAPTITLLNPPDNNIDNNVTQKFIFQSSENSNCTLWHNMSGIFEMNQTWYNITANTDVIMSVNMPSINTHIVWNVNCSDANGNDGFGTNNFTYYYDVTEPIITLNLNNAFNSNNYSLENQYDNNMTLNITFTDETDLYALSINITRNGVIFYNVTDETLSGTSYTFYKKLNTSNWSVGVYDIEIMTADSHTSNLINNYVIKKLNKNLEFDTIEGNNIKIYSEENAVTNAIKKNDRYEFEFNFDNKATKDRIFHIESDYKIDYRENSGYKAHFVIWNGNNGNWVDFEGVNGQPIVTKINNRHYTITFKNIDSYVKFNSIGGLNIITKNYLWYRGGYNLITPVAAAGETALLSLNITINDSIANLDADLFYNGVLQTNLTKQNLTTYITFNNTITSGDAETVDYYWNVTVKQGDGTTIRFNIDNTHTVTSWDIFNCTSGNISLTINIYDEDNPTTALETDVEINMEYWISSQANTQNFSVQMNGSNKYNICLTKPELTIYTDTYIKYTTKGFTHRYYLINQPLTNTTLNISMYNFDTTTGLSDLRITTRKFDYTYFPNIIGKLQRLYVGEDVWRTVQMDESGSYGLIFFNIKEEDTDYRIIFQDRSNNILKITDDMKFSCTSSLCEIVFLLDPYSAAAISPGLVYNAVYDDETGIITLIWNDPLGLTSSVRLLVTKETMGGTLEICDETKSGAAGTTTCDVSSYTGTLLIKVYSSASAEESLFTRWIGLNRTLMGNLINTEYGSTEGVIWTFGVLVTIVMTGLISPAFVIISMVFGLIVIFFFGIFTPLTLTFLIISVILGIIIGIRVKN